mgnify:CR=1 FL=1
MSFFKKVVPVNLYAACLNLISLLAMGALIVFQKEFPPLVPLWFSFSWGTSRLAEPEFLYLLPVLGLIFFLGSNLISKVLAKDHITLAQILVWTTSFLSLVLLISVYKIILLVS